MNTQYTVWTAAELKNGQLMLSGSVNGHCLSVGQVGHADTPLGQVKVEVVGTGVIDPNLVPADRQGILVKLLEGKATSLQGTILDFEGNNE